jgi:hypothetical protein
MRIDNYIKFLLTVITICLVYLCLRDIAWIPKVHADGPVEVVLVDRSGKTLSSTPYDPVTKQAVGGPSLSVTIEGK